MMDRLKNTPLLPVAVLMIAINVFALILLYSEQNQQGSRIQTIEQADPCGNFPNSAACGRQLSAIVTALHPKDAYRIVLKAQAYIDRVQESEQEMDKKKDSPLKDRGGVNQHFPFPPSSGSRFTPGSNSSGDSITNITTPDPTPSPPDNNPSPNNPNPPSPSPDPSPPDNNPPNPPSPSLPDPEILDSVCEVSPEVCNAVPGSVREVVNELPVPQVN